MMTFGQFFKQKRRETGKTLREFCRINGFDPGNMSKIERDILNPPQSHEKLRVYAKALNLKDGSDDWFEFFDLAAIGTGRLPTDVVSDTELVNALPVLFRSVRNKELGEEELHNLIKSIRGELR